MDEASVMERIGELPKRRSTPNCRSRHSCPSHQRSSPQSKKLAMPFTMATMNSQQLSGSADKEFARWKSIARVLEELQEVEARMVDIYQRVGSMVEADTEVLASLPRLSHHERMVSSDQAVVDVESRPASSPVTSSGGKKAKHTLSRNDKTMMN